MVRFWWAIAILAACGPGAAPKPASSSAPAAESPAGHIDRIERGLLAGPPVQGEPGGFALADRMRKYRVPAVSIAVFTDGKVQWAKAYGVADVDTGQPATDDTTFLAGSISKSVNAVAVMMAAADGTLSLDQPINELLGRWKLPDNELTRKSPVTPRRLLSHTAGTTVHGFPGYAAGAAIPTIEQILDGELPANTAAVRVDIAPGKQFRYSGGGTTITQLALTERTGRLYPEILRERVLGPIGMVHSSFDQDLTPQQLAHAAAGHGADGKVIAGKRHRYPEMAAAGLWTSAADLARFWAELSRARAGKSSIISRQIALEMTTGVAKTDGGSQVGLGVFLWQQNGASFFGHGGSDAGFQAHSIVSLEGGYGLVIMANSDNGFRLFPEIERAVFAEYDWKGRDGVLVPVALTAEQQARAAGTYLVGGQPATIAARGERLELRQPFQATVELIPVAADRFVAREGGTTYQLEAGGGLAVTTPGGASSTRAARLPAGTRLPILELEAGRFDEAVALWKKLARADDKQPAVDENHFNALGYTVMVDDPASAVLILRMVQAAEPDSSNAWDSLADAYIAAGDIAKAIDAYEHALRLLDKDPRIPAERKRQVRDHENKRLAELRAKLGR